jgi:D-psicose/D-tagatose/L-ribulose 3-epimerase
MTDRPHTNSTGVYALIWAGDTSRESIALAARRTAETGFDLLELSVHDPERRDVYL